MAQPDFLSRPMDKLTAEEWESICDGCGLCCQVTEEDEDTSELTQTNVACRYLCLESHLCKDYLNRQSNVENCVKVTPENIDSLYWLPPTCGYKLVSHGMDLPKWHHLICGDKNRVHTHGPSMLGDIISEDDIT